MAELTSEKPEQVLAACRENADEIAGALSRGLDGTFALSVGEIASLSDSTLPAEIAKEPGLAIVLKFGEVGAVALLSEASGLLPDWYKEPDPTGESKLSTLGQELSMLLVPDDLMADDFSVAAVDDIQAAANRGHLVNPANELQFEIAKGSKTGTLHMLWPVAAPDEVIPPKAEVDSAVEKEPADEEPNNAEDSVGTASGLDFSKLPAYGKSLLKITVPVKATLASKKMFVQEIVELGLGSIIKFDKSCEDMLDLYVGDRMVAKGEAVKVGDRYGLRINAIVLPEERFKSAG